MILTYTKLQIKQLEGVNDNIPYALMINVMFETGLIKKLDDHYMKEYCLQLNVNNNK